MDRELYRTSQILILKAPIIPILAVARTTLEVWYHDTPCGVYLYLLRVDRIDAIPTHL